MTGERQLPATDQLKRTELMKEGYFPCKDCGTPVFREAPGQKFCAACSKARRDAANRANAAAYVKANKDKIKAKQAEIRKTNLMTVRVLPVPGVDCPKKLCKKCGEPMTIRRDNGTPKGWAYQCKPCINASRREKWQDPAYREKVKNYPATKRRQAKVKELYANDPVFKQKVTLRAARSKSRMYKDPERHQRNLDTQRAWRARSNNRRNAVLKHKYGITLEDYERMLEEQGGVCDICGTDKPGQNQESSYSFHVDHDHETGAVRGLLCDRCNRGMGYFNDSSSILEKAVLYLKKHGDLGTAAS